MAKKVNLDALIPREDFDLRENAGSSSRNISTLAVRDLEHNSFFYSVLRKSDFQRKTNEWDAERITSLIESFLDGDLIPAVILWKNGAGYTFVIDGAHRISALAAWINNDFGDGAISKQFYDGIIPEEQLETAENTRIKVRKEIGLYDEYLLAIKNPDKVKKEIIDRAKLIGNIAIQVQWVEGDAKKAEASFFKINQKAAPIDITELKLLQARRKPNGIAARAILRAGKGHKYWSLFSEENQIEVQKLSTEINTILFKPTLTTPIKTLDIPIAGKNLSSQGQMLVLDFVNITNGINLKTKLDDDKEGFETIKFLKKCLKIAKLINSNYPSSLGLHPAIYFYARNGRHKPASFMAAIEFIIHLKNTNKINSFILVRKDFENIIINSENLIQQIVRRYRSGSNNVEHVRNFYMEIIQQLNNNISPKQIIENILKDKRFDYLSIRDTDINEITNNDFSSDRKSEIFIREALTNTIRCNICGGYIHKNSISFDHVIRKEDGGVGSVENGQLTHPYCNTGYKN
ncbi:MAG: hypothetical protein RLZZ422_207 [Pseudomonadota bacterium]|jgi:hypothetical protein